MQAPKLLTIPEAAERLGVSDATVRRRIKDGSLKATKLPGPFGEQYYIDPREINTAIEMVHVIPVKHEVEVKELEQLIVQTMAGSLEELHSDLVNIGSVVGEALKAQNEALRAEISVLHDTIKAIEERQKEREAAHYDLVDQRLRELKEEPKRGFWARLLGR
ncbi:MAG: helix-turn-helix domain-containing protein [Methanosarcina barkeri]|nr:helix-turn-helix domain-containing protein [Methanosarcina sp. ERenArc_MAG2]